MEAKSGWKTTEFWLTAIAVLVGLLVASDVLAPLGENHWAVKAVGLVAAALAAMGYNAGRAKAKARESTP